WSHVEDIGTWTDGPHAVLTAKSISWPADDMILEMTGRPFLVQDHHPSLTIDLIVNGTAVDRWSYCYPEYNNWVTRSARIAKALVFASTIFRMRLRIDKPAIPITMSIGSRDARELGILVSKLSFLTPRQHRLRSLLSGRPLHRC